MGLGKILASVTQLRQFHHHPFSNAERDSTYRPGGELWKKEGEETILLCTVLLPDCIQEQSVHMRTHTGEKPYMCPNCPLRFAQKAHLKNHLFTHTGEKPFSCQHCSAKFSRMSNLRRHSQTHHIALSLIEREGMVNLWNIEHSTVKRK
ncbi:gastrula zinc finger protein XlCGF57.1-like [Penaeus monodon]|uniref:gastrula zinc finger protein XlCGF57.1-like n=1 Tax=Penaeus monodon TaxID=6687 RepID=UPI0018A76E0B|nr:gastrula zinc finger protein XlCGF57.1-like [Penaeus monodon]